MKVVVRLLNGFSVMDETELPTEDLTKQKMQDFLTSTYQLFSGYEITYVDPDGDEIMVEYDDDYEVAKITHQQGTLILTVKVFDQQWLDQIGQGDQKASQDMQMSQNTNQKTQPVTIASPINEKQLQSTSQKDQPKYTQLIEEKQPNIDLLARQERLKLQQQQLQQLNQAFMKKALQLKTQELQAQQKVIEHLTNKRKTQTQSQLSSSSSQDEDEHLPPLITTKTAQQNDLISFDAEITQAKCEVKPQEQLKQKKEAKKVKKQKKQKKEQNQKPQKKNITLTQKQLKKLIKKQVLKLIPQISQQLKKSHQNQYHTVKITSAQLQRFSTLKCTQCEEALAVPFYINSSEGIRLCQNCEKQDASIIPLIKVRDPLMVENLIWAEPLCQIAKLPEHNPVKFYTEMKKSLQNQLKQKMDQRIKQAKTQAKAQKNQQKIKKTNEKQLKPEKQIQENPIDSVSSSV